MLLYCDYENSGKIALCFDGLSLGFLGWNRLCLMCIACRLWTSNGMRNCLLLFQLLHEAPQYKKHDQPYPKDEKPPVSARMMIEDRQSSATDHDSILSKHRPTMAPSTENHSLVIVLTVRHPDFLQTKRSFH